MKKIIYVCSALRGDIYNNTQKARAHCRFVVREGHIPLAVHLLFPQFLNEHIEAEREQGIAMGLELVSKCNELWSFGETDSDGMRREIKEAERCGIIIRRYDGAYREVEYDK